MGLINCTGQTLSAFGVSVTGYFKLNPKIYYSHNKEKEVNFNNKKIFQGTMECILEDIPEPSTDSNGKPNLYILTKELYWAAKLAGRNDVCYVDTQMDDNGNPCICIVKDIKVKKNISYEENHDIRKKEIPNGKAE